MPKAAHSHKDGGYKNKSHIQMKAELDCRNNISSPCEPSSTPYQSEKHLKVIRYFFHSHVALVKHEMVLITLSVHIFLTLQLEGKPA